MQCFPILCTARRDDTQPVHKGRTSLCQNLWSTSWNRLAKIEKAESGPLTRPAPQTPGPDDRYPLAYDTMILDCRDLA